MKKLLIGSLLALASITSYAQRGSSAVEVRNCMVSNTGNTLRNLDGSYCELKDGPVTCLVFDPFTDGGGISCTVNKGSDIGSLSSTNKHFKLKAVEGDVTRLKTGSHVCYIYAANRGGGPSCISP